MLPPEPDVITPLLLSAELGRFAATSPLLWSSALALGGLLTGSLLHPLIIYLWRQCRDNGPCNPTRPRRLAGICRRNPSTSVFLSSRICRLLIALSIAVLFVLAGLRFAPGAGLPGCLLLLCALLILAAIDAACLRLPDAVTQPLLWLGLLFNLGGTYVPLPQAVLGAIAGYLALWSLRWLFWWLRGKQALGYGDVKLLAALGAWLGWMALPLLLLMAATAGLLFTLCLHTITGQSLARPLAFGPWLALAGALLMLSG